MRLVKAFPVIAIVALVACEDQQTAQTQPAPPPAADTPAAPVTGEAARQDTELQAARPSAPDPDAVDPAAGLPQTALAPPPTPSSTFAGADALPPPDVSATGAVLADAPFDAGTYHVGDLTLDLSPDGDFTLTRSDTGETVSGDFRVYGDMMTFSNVGLNVAPGYFPMTCRVAAAPGGFRLSADGPSCALFDGQTFVRG